MKNAGSHWESNPGSLTTATSALTTEVQQPDNHHTNEARSAKDQGSCLLNKTF